MLLSYLLFEELNFRNLKLFLEADVSKLPKHVKGLKAYEMAYNRMLLKGLLRNGAKPLNLTPDYSELPKLVRTKNAYDLKVDMNQNSINHGLDDSGFYNTQKFRFGDVHDFIHLLTTTAAQHFVPSSVINKEDKFNINRINRKPAYVAIKIMKEKYNINVVRIVKELTDKNLIEIIQMSDENEAESELLQFYNLISKKVEVLRNSKNAEYENLKMISTFFRSMTSVFNSRNAHYSANKNLIDVTNDGYFVYSDRKVTNLPQYDTEEDTGNHLLFKREMNGEFFNKFVMTPFAEAIRTSSPVSEEGVSEMLRIINDDTGQRVFRVYDLSSDVTQNQLKTLKEFLGGIMVPLIKEYNHYIGLLNKVGA